MSFMPGSGSIAGIGGGGGHAPGGGVSGMAVSSVKPMADVRIQNASNARAHTQTHAHKQAACETTERDTSIRTSDANNRHGAEPQVAVPPGWRLVTSSTTGKVYWYNKISGKSTWEPPPGSVYFSATGSEGSSNLPSQEKALCDSSYNNDGLPLAPVNINADLVYDSEGAVVMHTSMRACLH